MNAIHQTENLLFSVIVQIIIMICAARLMNNVFRKMHQPGVIGEIVAGLLLGPSLFGHFFPEVSIAIFGAKPNPAISVLSQIGLLFLMFQIGLDFEYKNLKDKKNRNLVTTISVVSVVVPFISGGLIGYFSHSYFAPNIPLLPYILFIGTAVSITAVPIMGRILKQFKLEKTDMGLVAISSAAANDVVGWIILATISAISINEFAIGHLALQILGLLILIPLAKFVIIPFANNLTKTIDENNHDITPNMMAIIIIMILAFGLYTQKLGIFTIFGGFIMGLFFHYNHQFSIAWRKNVTNFIMVFLLPIFFTFTGLRTNVLGLVTPTEIMWLVIILLASILSKIVPVYFVARSYGYEDAQAKIVATLMNTRALMELIVLNVGYDLGILPQNIFTMLTIMAIVTTLITGPLLKVFLHKMGHAIDTKFES